MNTETIKPFFDILAAISSCQTTAWIYLPKEKNWSLNSAAAVLYSEEVLPEMEDSPDSGIPDFAKQNGLVQAITVSGLQDIVINARSQKHDAKPEDFLRAFLYYHKHDAFIDLAQIDEHISPKNGL
jgi:hypothetical protein